jgi:glycogen synthase
MKILYLVPRYYPAVGGSENLIKTFAERFAKEGHDVSVYTSNVLDISGLWAWMKERKTIDKEFEEINGVKVYRFPVNVNWLFKSFFLTKALRKVLQYVPIWQLQCLRGNIFSPKLFMHSFRTKEKFDIVHVTPVPFDSIFYCGYVIAKHSGAKLVCTPAVHIGENNGNNDYVKEYTRPYTLKVLEKYDLLLTNTDIETNFLKERLKNADNIHTLGLGIIPEVSNKGDGVNFRKDHNIPQGSTLLYYVGTKSRDKGVFDAVEAFDVLKKKYPDIYLVVAGNEFPDFKEFFDKFNKERIIYFDGPVDDKTKWDIFAAGDIMLYPSRTDSFGIAILEAWANKAAVIGSNAGGIPGVIDDGKNGLLSEFGNVKDLSSKIERFLLDRKMMTDFGFKGNEKLMERFTEDRIFHKINEFYSS